MAVAGRINHSRQETPSDCQRDVALKKYGLVAALLKWFLNLRVPDPLVFKVRVYSQLHHPTRHTAYCSSGHLTL